MVSKAFEKPVNNRNVDHLKKCSLFSDFQYVFRFHRSTSDLLTVVPDRIARLLTLNGIKVQVLFEKNIEKKHLCHHDKNCCYFCKSNISVINLIVGSRNMIKLSKNMSL